MDSNDCGDRVLEILAICIDNALMGEVVLICELTGAVVKAFNLKAKMVEVGGKEREAIALGENGRGRKLTLVKCAVGIQDGFLVTVKTPKPGMPGVVQIGPSSDSSGWLVRISTVGSYIRGADGNIKSLGGEGAQVIARGHGAFGDAGRTGTWDDLLIAVDDGAILRVKPSRGDAYFLVFGSSNVQKLSAPDAEFEGIPVDQESYKRL
jgi:hypothetical protein